MIDRYDIEVSSHQDGEECYATYYACKYSAGDFVYYEDHERIVKELEDKIEDLINFPSSQGG